MDRLTTWISRKLLEIDRNGELWLYSERATAWDIQLRKELHHQWHMGNVPHHTSYVLQIPFNRLGNVDWRELADWLNRKRPLRKTI